MSALTITVFDYGAGNLHSLTKALEVCQARVRVETDAERAVRDTDALVLPGVGAFAPAAERLKAAREARGDVTGDDAASRHDAMRHALNDGLPCLGICLGMQLLFEGSDEGEGHGLGMMRGWVTRIRSPRVPHIGWNQLTDVSEPLLLASDLTLAYYANSFACRPTCGDGAEVTAWSEHDGDRFPAIVRRGATVGVQFHPEKSSAPGLRFLQGFLREVADGRDAV